MPDTTPEAMRLARNKPARRLAKAYMGAVIDMVAGYVSKDNRPMDTKDIERRRVETLEAIARALDDAGVREAVEQLTHLRGMSAAAINRGDTKMVAISVNTICARALSALTGENQQKAQP